MLNNAWGWGGGEGEREGGRGGGLGGVRRSDRMKAWRGEIDVCWKEGAQAGGRAGLLGCISIVVSCKLQCFQLVDAVLGEFFEVVGRLVSYSTD